MQRKWQRPLGSEGAALPAWIQRNCPGAPSTSARPSPGGFDLLDELPDLSSLSPAPQSTAAPECSPSPAPGTVSPFVHPWATKTTAFRQPGGAAGPTSGTAGSAIQHGPVAQTAKAAAQSAEMAPAQPHQPPPKASRFWAPPAPKQELIPAKKGPAQPPKPAQLSFMDEILFGRQPASQRKNPPASGSTTSGPKAVLRRKIGTGYNPKRSAEGTSARSEPAAQASAVHSSAKPGSPPKPAAEQDEPHASANANANAAQRPEGTAEQPLDVPVRGCYMQQADAAPQLRPHSMEQSQNRNEPEHHTSEPGWQPEDDVEVLDQPSTASVLPAAPCRQDADVAGRGWQPLDSSVPRAVDDPQWADGGADLADDSLGCRPQSPVPDSNDEHLDFDELATQDGRASPRQEYPEPEQPKQPFSTSRRKSKPPGKLKRLFLPEEEPAELTFPSWRGSQSSDDGDLLVDISFITTGGTRKIPAGGSSPSVQPPKPPGAAEGTPMLAAAESLAGSPAAEPASGSTPLTIPLAGGDRRSLPAQQPAAQITDAPRRQLSRLGQDISRHPTSVQAQQRSSDQLQHQHQHQHQLQQQLQQQHQQYAEARSQAVPPAAAAANAQAGASGASGAQAETARAEAGKKLLVKPKLRLPSVPKPVPAAPDGVSGFSAASQQLKHQEPCSEPEQPSAVQQRQHGAQAGTGPVKPVMKRLRKVAAAADEPKSPYDRDTPMAEADQSNASDGAGSGSDQDNSVSGDEDSDGGSDGGSDGFGPEDDQDGGVQSDDSDVQIIAQIRPIKIEDSSDEEPGPVRGGVGRSSGPGEPSGQPWWHRLPDFVPVEALKWGTDPRDGSTVFVAYADQFSAVPSTAAARQTGKAALARLKDSSRDSEPARPPEGHWITEGSGYRPRKVYIQADGTKKTGTAAYKQSEKDRGWH